ncbi:hypothetical protein LAZ40_18000 [Cereibacter sphaeroides]|uniref:hypothetical protein n=1 Tax=Cereibacter sphaeroides TaxID=1063 RepID=UPI001F215F34|nr:hypothetical protein [Cereibacter sphaeroides]MCE6952383.1 hypothetical protein [Cereibacter sphaeroides]MCE6960922.1 hypothetical protein [Cereibacter sphaeroides]MCE6969780.1 hypothetical protein [Cereibacter sphaeroides]MCE6975255.1 hypothetical protein [Cereibacter sphaeroides]
MSSDGIAGSVERLLDDMRRMVTAGDLAALPGLSAELAEEIEALEPLTAERAQQIRTKATRNLACLEAASRGVRAARRRLEEIRHATSGMMVVYDDRGRRAETAPERPPRQRL